MNDETQMKRDGPLEPALEEAVSHAGGLINEHITEMATEVVFNLQAEGYSPDRIHAIASEVHEHKTREAYVSPIELQLYSTIAEMAEAAK